MDGLRQGDALACVLFNIALEKAIRDSGVTTRGTIDTRSNSVLGYADDIDIIGRTAVDTKQAFVSLERAAERMVLKVNEGKTKFMAISSSQSQRNRVGQNFSVDDYNFEVVHDFTYLGSRVNDKNEMSEEIKHRLTVANRCYYGLQKQFSSRLLSRRTKIKLYKTLVKPVLLYGSETWTLTKRDETLLECFERKVLRKIYGAVRENHGWRRRYNHELAALYNDVGIARGVKINRLRWAGHVQRQHEEMVAKRHLMSETNVDRWCGDRRQNYRSS